MNPGHKGMNLSREWTQVPEKYALSRLSYSLRRSGPRSHRVSTTSSFDLPTSPNPRWENVLMPPSPRVSGSVSEVQEQGSNHDSGCGSGSSSSSSSAPKSAQVPMKTVEQKLVFANVRGRTAVTTGCCMGLCVLCYMYLSA